MAAAPRLDNCWFHLRNAPVGSHSSTVLRKTPTLRSDHVRTSNEAVVILHPRTIVTIDSWDLQNGYVEVSTMFEKEILSGWVQADYLQLKSRGFQYKRLTDENWWQSGFYIDSETCSIKVARGSPMTHEDLKEQLSQLGCDGKDIFKKKYWEDGYTYVSLEFDNPYRVELTSQVCGRLHITVAYAASMLYDSELNELRALLQRCMKKFFATMPQERPRKLPHYKQLFFKDPNAVIVRQSLFHVTCCPQLSDSESEIGSSSSVSDLSKANWGSDYVGSYQTAYAKPLTRIKRLLKDGLILDTRHGDKEETFANYVCRIWDRDRERYRAFLEREKIIEEGNQGTLYMNTPSSGLGDSDELLCLLEYLADLVYFHPSCQLKYKTSSGKLKSRPPCITASDKWHCSLNSFWERSPIVSTQIERLVRLYE